jgi:UDP-3-O-[3-hydroxymyristoyl] glucosamine N-acyltransferase
MRWKMNLKQIASLIDGSVKGDDGLEVSGLSPIDNIQANTIVVADNKDKMKLAERSSALAIIINKDFDSQLKPVIKVEHPMKAFIELMNHFYPKKIKTAGIHASAQIAEGVSIGKNVHIGANVVIEHGSKIGDNTVIRGNCHVGENVIIGKHCELFPNVTLYDDCIIGNHVVIHASTVIGSDGFGYSFIEDKHMKIPHVGNVIIEDNVEIGANTVVDRASLGSTRIGQGTKIDNLVQVAHSVTLGKNNILCAFTGIAGSTTCGDNVICAANVGISDHVTIEDNVTLGARTGVPPKKRLRAGNVYLGAPPRLIEKGIEIEIGINRLPKLHKSVKELKNKIKQLENQLVD